MLRMKDFRLGDHSGTLSSHNVSVRAGGSPFLGRAGGGWDWSLGPELPGSHHWAGTVTVTTESLLHPPEVGILLPVVGCLHLFCLVGLTILDCFLPVSHQGLSLDRQSGSQSGGSWAGLRPGGHTVPTPGRLQSQSIQLSGEWPRPGLRAGSGLRRSSRRSSRRRGLRWREIRLLWSGERQLRSGGGVRGGGGVGVLRGGDLVTLDTAATVCGGGGHRTDWRRRHCSWLGSPGLPTPAAPG